MSLKWEAHGNIHKTSLFSDRALIDRLDLTNWYLHILDFQVSRETCISYCLFLHCLVVQVRKFHPPRSVRRHLHRHSWFSSWEVMNNTQFWWVSHQYPWRIFGHPRCSCTPRVVKEGTFPGFSVTMLLCPRICSNSKHKKVLSGGGGGWGPTTEWRKIPETGHPLYTRQCLLLITFYLSGNCL